MIAGEITKTKKTELLFLALFVRMLQIGGRCASIVPDGVLFGNSTGHKSIRRELIDNQRLQAVISMPSGVFKPYAGVSTAILIFTKTNAGGTDKVWFYDMKADGFSLDDKRSPVAENDIADIVSRYHHLEAEESRTGTGSLFVRFTTEFLSVFTMYVVRSSSFVKGLISEAKGATMLNLNSSIMENLKFPVPPLSLQQSFADKITAKEQQKAAITQSIAETQKLFDYTMNKYFG